MENKATSCDPAHIASFYAVARAGSLLAASDAGSGSLSTLSRHISALEAQIGDSLFDRRPDGMVLTHTGTRLLSHAQRLHEAKMAFGLAADGLEDAINGTVRIAASTAAAGVILPAVLRKLAVHEPALAFDVIASDKSANLLMGEADIALRAYTPTQSQLIAKRVGQYTIGAFASRGYLATHGEPTTLDDLHNHALIGDDTHTDFYDGLAALGFPVGRDAFRYRTDNRVVALAFLLGGCGIGLAPSALHTTEPSLVRVLPDDIHFSFPLWLVAGPNLRSNHRTRRVFDFLSTEIPAGCALHTTL